MALLLQPGVRPPQQQNRRKVSRVSGPSAPNSDSNRILKPSSASCAALPSTSSKELGGAVGCFGSTPAVPWSHSWRGASSAPHLGVTQPVLRGVGRPGRPYGEMGGKLPVFCSGQEPVPSNSDNAGPSKPRSRRSGGPAGEVAQQVVERAVSEEPQRLLRFTSDGGRGNSDVRDGDKRPVNGGDPWLESENGVHVQNGKLDHERWRQRTGGEVPWSDVFQSRPQDFAASSRKHLASSMDATADNGHSYTDGNVHPSTPELLTGVLAADVPVETAEVIFSTVKEAESEILKTSLPHSENAQLSSGPQGQETPALWKSDEKATGGKGSLVDGLVNALKPIWQWGKAGGDKPGMGKNTSRDWEVLQEGMTSVKRSLGDLLRLKRWEDWDGVVETDLSWPEPQYRGLVGTELLAADIEALSSYWTYVKGHLNSYRIPLRQSYDPEAIASYFNRRPHLLLLRLVEVFTAFSGVFLLHLLDKAEPGQGNSRMAGINADQLSLRSAKALKRTVVTLGPTFIKVAQSLSSRPDIIGSDTAKVLSELQDRLPPFSTKDAVAVIEEELGIPLTRCFSSLSSDPVAAASFGQVYQGVTVEGEEVAVKVQRPDLLYSVARDVYVLRLGLGIVRKVAKMNSDISVLADEVGRGLFGELDYSLEAANAKEFGSAHERLSYMKVPKTLSHLTRRRVLTMEWIHGDRPVDLLQIAQGHDLHGALCSMEQRLEAKRSLDALVRKGVECSLVQLLETGVMHADPHPGNLLYTREGILAYLDFGLLARVVHKHRMAMLAVIAHLVNGEWQSLANDFADLDILKPSTDRFALRLALERAFGDGPDAVVRNGVPDIQFSQVTGKLWKVALKFRFRLPAYYTFVLRALASLEGIAVSVDPNYKVFSAAYPYVIRRLLNDNSQATRRVLQSLVLTEGGEFRWDRISALAEMSAICPSPDTGWGQQGSKQAAERLVSLSISKEGGPIRRIILEADTQSLAIAFASGRAKTLRRKVSYALGDALYDAILRLTHMEGKQSGMRGAAESTEPMAGMATTAHSNLSSSTAALPGATSLDRSSAQIFRNRRLWFLLKALTGRLRSNPIVILRVGWAFATMAGLATALALRRYIMTVIDRLLHVLRKKGFNKFQRPVESGKRPVQANSVHATSAS